MYMSRIEAAEEIQLLLPENQPEPGSDGRGATLLGIGFLVVALPYWGLRLLATALWGDVKRAGRVVGIAGASYAEALKRD